MNNTQLLAVMEEAEACGESRLWVGARSLANAWRDCEHPGWMAWALWRIGFSKRKMFEIAFRALNDLVAKGELQPFIVAKMAILAGKALRGKDPDKARAELREIAICHESTLIADVVYRLVTISRECYVRREPDVAAVFYGMFNAIGTDAVRHIGREKWLCDLIRDCVPIARLEAKAQALLKPAVCPST